MKSYNKNNIPLAKVLRKNMTCYEKKLWYDFLRVIQGTLGPLLAEENCEWSQYTKELREILRLQSIKKIEKAKN